MSPPLLVTHPSAHDGDPNGTNTGDGAENGGGRMQPGRGKGMQEQPIVQQDIETQEDNQVGTRGGLHEGENGGSGATTVSVKREENEENLRQAAARRENFVLPSGITEPLDINSKAKCLWRDGSYRNVKIIEHRIKYNSNLNLSNDQQHVNEWEYYVHFVDFNRRLDTWVTIKDLDVASLETDKEKDALKDKDGKEAGRTRNQKRKVDDRDEHHAEEGHEDLDPARVREHEELTKVKNIGRVEIGKWDIDTWYFSPFPKEFEGCSKLYICEFCLTFLKRKEQLQRHLRKCELRHPPGDEIYRNNNISMFEVDGRKEKVYCQNLCYIAKLFLDHKTLYYDVDLFLFYVLCETDERGCHLVGYFSKEKNSEEGYNLACILTMPPYQRKGYGKFLISFSYELSKKEGKIGTPERPLSDLGVVSYRGYWTRVLLTILKEKEGSISVKELSDMTMFKHEDIISTLQHHNLIQYQKGQHVLCAAPKVIEHHMKLAGRPGVQVDPAKLIWTPYNAERDYNQFRG